MNDMSTSEIIPQPDIKKSKIDIDDFRSILGKLTPLISKIGPSLSQAIKSPKADVTILFFQLIELFSDYFEKSTLPRDYTRILFAYVTILHHFAVNLYCPGVSHTDLEFTQLWKNFSWIFRNLQTYIFPNDYGHVIDQITQGFMPLNPQLDEKIQEKEEINQTFKSFLNSLNNLQDPRINTENFKKIYNDFTNLKKLIRKFCQRIKMFPPHLFNALSLTEYILNCGCLFVHIRDTVNKIDTKLQESSILSIHLPLELNETNIQVHRRFLISSIKINQVVNRLIFSKITETNSELSNKISHPFYVSTTILMHFQALFGIYLDSLLLSIWKKYVAQSNAFLSLIDIRAVFQKQSTQNSAQKSSPFQKNRNFEQIILSNLTNEISLISQDSNIFSLYEEFIRLYSYIVNDRSPKSLHHLAHCIILLLKISNETDSDSLRISVHKTIDMIVTHLILSKAYDDLVRFENIIKVMNDIKKKFEQQKQLQIQQIPRSTQTQQQSQIKSSNSNANLSSNPSNSLNIPKQSQSMIPHQLIIANLPNESPYQSLVALCNHISEIITSLQINSARHPVEWRILSYYLNYLDLLVTIGAPKGNEDGNMPIELLQYHPSHDQIIQCLTKFFNDTINEVLPFSVTVPPVIFSSYPLSEPKLSPSDMQRISTLLLTERRKERDAQYVVLEYSKLSLYIAQIQAFLDKCKGIISFESKNLVEFTVEPNLANIVNSLLKLKKEKTFYSTEESRDMADAILPLLLKLMYNKSLPQFNIEKAINKVIKSLYVPRCTELIKQCYLTMDFFDSLFNKNPMLRSQITDLKSLFIMTFSPSFDSQKYNQTKQIIESIALEIKKNDPQAFEEDNNYFHLKSIEKFIVLCKLLNTFTEYSKVEDENAEKSEDGDKDEPKSSSKKSSRIPYVSILSKVNHISLIRQKLIEGKKLNLFSSKDSNPESQSFDDFCSSLINEIDEALATNKFIRIHNSKLDDIIKKFSKKFNLQLVLKNLISYFEEWASYLRNINEMSSIPELIIDRNLKYIKTHLTESLNNMQHAPERISNTIRIVRKRSLELQKDPKTMESLICQFMAPQYIERATNVLTCILLIKYPLSIEPSPMTASSVTTAPITQQSSAQALTQLQQQIRFQNGSSSTSSLPYVYSTKPQQQQQQSKTQPQVIQVTQPYPYPLHQIQKIQQQQQQQQQQKQPGIQFIQNQQGQMVQGAKIPVPLYTIYYNPANQQQPQQIIPSISGIPQILSDTNLASQKLNEILRLLQELPCTQSTVSLREKCNELKNGSFPRFFSVVSTISPERVNIFQLQALRTLKSSLMSNICKLEANSKKKDLLSLNEHFERCLNLIDIQSHQKDEQIGRLKDTIEDLEEKIRELEKKMPRDEAASPEIISALDSILEDDILTSFMNENSFIPAPTSESTLSTSSSNSRIGGPRRRGRQRGKSSYLQQENQEEISENKDEDIIMNPTSLISSTSKTKTKSKSSSSSIVNSLLLQVKNAEILNKRLHRKIERLQFPNCTPPLSQEKFTEAYPLNLGTYEGCSWIASNVKESVSNRNELSKLQDERDQLFEQMIRTNSSKSTPLKPEMIEGLYSNIISSCSSANSSNSSNGKVSKSAILSFIDKSDTFFTYVDYDIQVMRKKLKSLKLHNRMTPAEHIAQFTKKLQSLE